MLTFHLNFLNTALMIRRVKYKLCLFAIKYIPVFSALIMLISYISGLCGIQFTLGPFFCSLSFAPAILLLLISDIFNFCWIHKSFTIYTILASTGISIERFIGFGAMYDYVGLFMIISGLILFAILAFRIKKYHYKCCVLQTNYPVT